MKTLITTLILLVFLSFLCIGCKDDPTKPPDPPDPGVDFTMSYQIVDETCEFYFTPSLDNHIDTVKSEYPAGNYSEIFTGDPTTTFNAGVTYYLHSWDNMPRPATWKFTFIGRKVSDNSRYRTVKDFTVP